jgi:hypothetical protein
MRKALAHRIADEPCLFQSATAALAFAFNFSQGSPKTTLGALQKPDPNRRPGRGLVGLDGAAQAGMVLAEVRELAKPRQSALTVMFAIRTTECTCCGNPTLAADWNGAIKHLAELSAVSINGVSQFRVRYAILLKIVHSMMRESDDDMAERFCLDPKTIRKYRHAIKEWYEGLERGAMREIDDRLRACGMVGHTEG